MYNYIFAFTNKEPKYKQIYSQIKALIEHGTLKEDEQLPSIRALADTLKVSRNTTLTAYEQLAAEGYIQGENRRGYYVNKLEQILLDITVNDQPDIDDYYDENIQIDFRTGAVEQQHFPINKWRSLSNQVLKDKNCYLYGENYGQRALREQIASYLIQARGIHVEAKEIIIGSSTQQLLLYVGLILKKNYNSIILENPGYNGALEAFKMLDFAFETLPVTSMGYDLKKLQQYKSQLLYVTPSHQFPYGVSLSIKERQQLILWAEKKKGYIIEDDYDSEFRYKQQPFPALAAANRNHVIYFGTFSKSFLPGIRLAYMVLPPQICNTFKSQFARFEHNASIIHQLTMAEFMKEGEWVRHIKRMRNIYKQKIQFLIEFLKETFQESITIIGEQSGLYILIQVHTDQSESCLVEKALKKGVKVYPTIPYFIDRTKEEPIIQLGFSNLAKHEIELGINLLKEAWINILND